MTAQKPHLVKTRQMVPDEESSIHESVPWNPLKPGSLSPVDQRRIDAPTGGCTWG